MARRQEEADSQQAAGRTGRLVPARAEGLDAIQRAALTADGPLHPGQVRALQGVAGNTAVVQRLARDTHQHGEGCGHQAPAVQRRATATPVVQRRSTVPDVINSAGSPLDSAKQSEMEYRFDGADFSRVRVHNDAKAQESAAEVGALAYTSGHDIVLGSSSVPDNVLAHELEHTLQQEQGEVTTRPFGDDLNVSPTNAPEEVAAEAKSQQVMRKPLPSVADSGSQEHGHDHAHHAHAEGAAVQRMPRPGGASPAGGVSAAPPVVQRMESPPRGRGSDYEADASSSGSDSSPERRALRERIEQGLGDMDDLVGQTDRLGLEGPGFRRIRPVHHSESESSSEAAEAATGAAGPAHPTLPENELLKPLRDLLMKEMSKGGLSKKLKVSFKVDGGDPDPRNDAVGHAWIEITNSKGKEVSFGFYPTERHHPIRSTRGGVQCPDRYGHATHSESKNVPLRDIINGYQIANDRSRAAYNLSLHNCSTFAGDVWKAMTGKSIPTEWFTAYGLLSNVMSTPHGAAEGIEAHQDRRRQGRVDNLRPRMQGPMSALIPGAANPDEAAAAIADSRYSQTSSSQSSEEVD
ncbi:protein of unknown function DUF4157 [Actinobacteria bacterium OK074]|nr:protein of unknown function DUF4157 [Actinobacteria bacterium OK074]